MLDDKDVYKRRQTFSSIHPGSSPTCSPSLSQVQVMAIARFRSVLSICFACTFFLNHLIIGMAKSERDTGEASKELIEDVCRRTTEFDICTSLLESDPRKELKTNPEGFVWILLDYVLTDSTNIHSCIGDFLKNTTDNTIECLDMCYNFYDYGIRSLQAAMQLLYQEDGYKYGQMNLEVTNFHIQIHDCQDCFAERRVKDTMLLSMQNYLVRISVAALQIINIVECNDINGCS